MTVNRDDYAAGSSLAAYYPTRTTDRIARLWQREITAHNLADLGAIDFFEGSGSDPTALTGYATNKLWLRVEAGITSEVATVHYYAGGDADVLASWPELTREGFSSHIGARSGAELDLVWSTETSGDPGTGKILGNNATLASVTALHLAKTGRQSQGYASRIETWDDDDVVRVYAVGSESNFLDVRLTATPVDQGDYYTIPCAVRASASLANGAIVGVAHYPTATAIDLAEAAQAAAEEATALAEEWAAKTDGVVEATDYSAKAWAVGGTGVTDTATRGSAKDWATKAEDSTVDETGYSALHHAAKASAARALAQTAQAAAETAETNAESAQAASEAARDAAFVAADVYADIATGLAAVADDEQFMVVDGNEIVRYRRDDASNQTEMARYPASSALDFKSVSMQPLQVVDDDNNLLMDIQSGIRVASDGQIETSSIITGQRVLAYAFAVCDEAGNLAFAARLDGSVVTPATDARRAITTRRSGGVWGAEIAHIICYGQSLSVGQALPTISTVQNYDNIMFEYGMRPQYDYPADSANWYNSFVPAVEESSSTFASLGETPSMGTGDAIKELILAEYGVPHTAVSYQILLSNPGFGAQTLASLSQGTVLYTGLIAQVTAAKALADAAGKKYFVPAVTWMQGEDDVAGNTRAGYASALATFASNLDIDIRAVTGQTETVQLVCYQLTSKGAGYDADITLAMADAATATANIHLAMPMYMMTHPDGVHVDGVGSRWAGAYFGRVIKHICIDNETWRPLEPDSASVSGAIANITFHVPTGYLVFDVDAVREADDYGFILKNGSGTAQNITSVAIIAPNVIKIVCDTTIGADWTLEYATTGEVGGVAGPTTGARGNLRDTAGDTYTFDPNGIAKPMHNWCRAFIMEL